MEPSRPSKPVFTPPSPDGAFIAGFTAAAGRFEDQGIRFFLETGNPEIPYIISDRLFGLGESVTESNCGYFIRIAPAIADSIQTCLNTTDSWWNEAPDDIKWAFICGLFEALGEFRYDYRRPRIQIAKAPGSLMELASGMWNVEISKEGLISAAGYKAIDICGRMYESAGYRQGEKYDSYLDILNWEPFPSSPWLKHACFKCKRLDPRAVIPRKNRPTDSGYDIFAIELTYDPETDLYTADTRLAVEPIPGYYFDMVGRSSLPSSGFFAAGGVGIIDRSYVGSVKMRLKKFRESAPVPTLPFRCGQLIPRKIIHVPFAEVDELAESDRGRGGFGSTGV